MTYQPVGTTFSIPCPQGYFCPTGSLLPTPCPSGSYCSPGSSSNIYCPAGSYCPALASAAIDCSAGNYCPVGSGDQIPCPGNTYSVSGQSSCGCIVPPSGISSTQTSDGTDCIVVCQKSYNSYRGVCYLTSVVATYVNSVYTCPVNYSINGIICTFSGDKVTCPNGYIKKESKCIPCSPGQISVNNACVQSDPGYASALGVEVICPAGTWGAAGATSCTLCPAGTFSAIPGQSSSYSCLSCPINTYSALAGASRCTKCPVGQGTTAVRQQACIVCTSCPSGSYAPNCTGSCASCKTPNQALLEYTTQLCGTDTNTITAFSTTCSSGQFLNGYSSGNANTLGSAGTCTLCKIPQQKFEYTQSVCTAISDTITSFVPNYDVMNKLTSFSAGSYNQTGSYGDIVRCTVPSLFDYLYVVGICDNVLTDTVLAAAPTCSPGQYRNGPIGDPTTLGNPGACTNCSTLQDANHFVSSACTKWTDTVILPCFAPIIGLTWTFSACTSISDAVLRNCTPPNAGQYVISTCTATQDTVFGTKPGCAVNTVHTGYVQGSTTQVGSSGYCCTAGTPSTCTAACSPPRVLTNAGAGSPGYCCTPPGAGQYVSSACTPTSDAVIRTCTQPGAGQYVSSACTSTSDAVIRTCTEPGAGQYVSSACTLTQDTVVVTLQACNVNKVRVGYSQGSSTQVGTAGYCCTTPGIGKYVRSTCTSTRDTGIDTAPTCAYGQPLVGYIQGSPTELGSAGYCQTTALATNQYVISGYTPTTNAVLGLAPTCTSYETLVGFSQGSLDLGGGTRGYCQTTTLAANQYVISGYTSTTNAVLGLAPTCTSYQTLVGFSQGSLNLGGGTRGYCRTTTLAANQYVKSVYTSTSDFELGVALTCTAKQTLTMFSQGSVSATRPAIGSPGFCCTTPGTGEYVSQLCNATQDTVLATAPTCNSNQTRIGYTPGHQLTTYGTSGCCSTNNSSCVLNTGQYVIRFGSSVPQILIGTVPDCNGLRQGFNAGSPYTYNGTLGTCCPYIATNVCACPAGSPYATMTRFSC